MVATNDALASLELVVYARVNAWLQAHAAGNDSSVRAAVADLIATSRTPGYGLRLPLAARSRDHYALASSTHIGMHSAQSYVLVEKSGVAVGRWPTAQFDQQGFREPPFPAKVVALASLRALHESFAQPNPPGDTSERHCSPPLVLIDGTASASRLAEVVRAMGDCAVVVAVAREGRAEGHVVGLRNDPPKASTGPEVPEWLRKAPRYARIAAEGTVAQLVRRLDALDAAGTYNAVLTR